MKQILHIFRKDTRHFWLEILVVILFLMSVVLHFPIRWTPIGNTAHSQNLNAIVNVQIVLMPLTWWLLVGRVIHGETLVGENQFWLTRPYEWKKLLGAKALFLFVWLCVPILLAQCAVLAEAGFHPISYIPGMLSSLVLVLSLGVMPVVALATITANFGRLTLTLLAVGICILGSTFAWSSYSTWGAVVPYHTFFIYPSILALFTVLTVMQQYSTRKVWIGRSLAAAMFISIGLAGIALRGAQQSGITRAYAAATPVKPVQLDFRSELANRVTSDLQERTDQVNVRIPVTFSGVAPGSLVQADNVKYTVDTPDGYHWTAPWIEANASRYPAGEHSSSVFLIMDRDLYDRLGKTPFNLHLTLAVTRLIPLKATAVEVGKRDFEVPGVGICSNRSFFGRSGLHCRSAIKDPILTHVETRWSLKPCSGPQPDASKMPYGEEWLGVINPTVSELPVQVHYSNLNQYSSEDQAATHWHSLTLCPGTPVTFTQYQPAERTQVELTIPNFKLPTLPQH